MVLITIISTFWALGEQSWASFRGEVFGLEPPYSGRVEFRCEPHFSVQGTLHESGEFECRVPRSRYLKKGSLTIEVNGAYPLELQVTPRLGEEIDLGDYSLTPGLSLHGIVLNEFDRPVPDAVVYLQPLWTELERAERLALKSMLQTSTNEQGRFQFPSLGHRYYEVLCRDSGVITCWPGAQPITLHVSPPAFIRGSLYSKNGKHPAIPIDRARVFFIPHLLKGSLWRTPWQSRTHENGLFSLEGLPLVPGTLYLCDESPGYLVRHEINFASEVRGLDFLIDRPPKEKQDRPLAKEPLGTIEFRVWPPHVEVAFGGRNFRGTWRTKSRIGKRRVKLDAPGYRSSWSDIDVIENETVVCPVRLVSSPYEPRYWGTIYENGVPSAQQRVSLRRKFDSDFESIWLEVDHDWTDEEGNYQLRLGPPTLEKIDDYLDPNELIASSSARIELTPMPKPGIPVLVERGAIETTDVPTFGGAFRVDFNFDGAAFNLRCFDGEGEPISFRSARLHRRTPGKGQGVEEQHWWPSHSSSFVAEFHVKTGDYTLQLNSESHGPVFRKIKVEANIKELRVDLDTSHSISVHFPYETVRPLLRRQDPITGNLIMHRSVHRVDALEGEGGLKTVFSKLQSGTYQLRYWLMEEKKRVSFTHTLEITPESEREIHLHFGR